MAKPKTQSKPVDTAKPAAKSKPDHAEVTLSRCKVCDSTDREKYFGTPYEFDISGEHAGRPYNRIVRRRTKCSNCGQQRLDSFYENTSR